MAILEPPATRPLTVAMIMGSADDNFRVRLLSIPQHMQAPTIRAAPMSSDTLCPSQASRRAPRTIASATEQKALVNVLPKDEPRNRHCCEAFEVQQQGTRGGRGLTETQHHQQGPKHAANNDNCCQPWNIVLSERSFRGRMAKRATYQMNGGQPQTRAEIQQSSELWDANPGCSPAPNAVPIVPLPWPR